jgi:hypothetical protein
MARTILNPARFNNDGGLGTRLYVRTAFFDEGYGVSERFSDYKRGGPIVPNTAAFSGVGLGTVGSPLRLSQFSGLFIPSLTLDTQTVTVGTLSFKGINNYGFDSGVYGSISDGTFNPISNATITALVWSSSGYGLLLRLSGNRANSGWNTVTINGIAYNRSSATYSYDSGGNATYWYMAGENPFGTTVGATRTAVFT